MEPIVQILDKNQVAEKLQVSTRQINNLVAEGLFPPGVRSGKKLLWHSSAVDRYLEEMFVSQLNFKPSSSPIVKGALFLQNFDI
jgi:prophage regulatory protein